MKHSLNNLTNIYGGCVADGNTPKDGMNNIGANGSLIITGHQGTRARQTDEDSSALGNHDDIYDAELAGKQFELEEDDWFFGDRSEGKLYHRS